MNGELLLLLLLLLLPLIEGCHPPPVPLNAKVIVRNNTATYTCDPGFELFGSPSIQCVNARWDPILLQCATNVALNKPSSASSLDSSSADSANDGLVTSLHEGHNCAVTLSERSPYWIVDLLEVHQIFGVKVIAGDTLQNLEIRVGNSSEIKNNNLCSWQPGEIKSGVPVFLKCALEIRGRYVGIQRVGENVVLSICEAFIYSTNALPVQLCSRSSDVTNLSIFNGTCYRFQTSGADFQTASQTCSSSSSSVLFQKFNQNIYSFIKFQLNKINKNSNVSNNLIWIGARRDGDVWRWLDGSSVVTAEWGDSQPNNYNGNQNCVVLDYNLEWRWNDVGCGLNYLKYYCQHDPVKCGSPDALSNTTVTTTTTTTAATTTATYRCIKNHALLGSPTRYCRQGRWTSQPPTCQYIDCGPPKSIENGSFHYETQEEEEDRHLNTYNKTITYKCHLNHTLTGSNKVICTESGIWQPNPPQCLYSYCPPLEAPPNGQVLTSGSIHTAGDTAEYVCNHGHYHLNGPKIINCLLGGSWSSQELPVCRYIDCGVPREILNGEVTLLNSTTYFGSVAVYKCESDHYFLNGSAERVCGRDNKWSGFEPSCHLVDCGEPAIPDHGYVTGHALTVTSQLEYHCDEGYRMEVTGRILEVRHVRTCQVNGTWSGDVPECLYTDCNLLETPLNSALTIHYGEGRNTHLGSTATFHCAAHHRLDIDTNSTECKANGEWSVAVPECVEVRCGPPPPSPASSGRRGSAQVVSITGSNHRLSPILAKDRKHLKVDESYSIGSVANYKCLRGFAINGSASLRCGSDGDWSSSQPPDCTYVDCGPPPSLDHGYYRLLSNRTHFGSQASYQCEGDYRLEGSVRRQCQEDGKWGGKIPVCKAITCPHPSSLSLPPTLVFDLDLQTTVGSEVKFKCQQGMILTGDKIKKCQRNGRWSGRRFPKCTDVLCELPPTVPNGRTVQVNGTVVYNAMIEVHCLPGYAMYGGDFQRTCLADGTWSGKRPQCLTEEERQQQELNNNNNNNNKTGVWVGLIIGLILLLLILAVIVYIKRRQKLGVVKEGGGGGDGGVGERPPLPPPNETKNTIIYSNLVDPITGNNIYENIDEGFNTTTATTTTPTTTPPTTTTTTTHKPTTTIARPTLPPPAPPTALITVNGININNN